MKLWKVNVKRKDIKDKNVSTEEDIVNRIDGKKMEPEELFEEYFQGELNNQNFKATNIHIIAIIPTTDYPNKKPRLIQYDNVSLNLNRLPTQLLHTNGFHWDYQASPEFEKKLKKYVRQLYTAFKHNSRDKDTPIFFMASGAGCGKSRNATEIPRILREKFADDLELGSRLKDAIIFNITLENGTRINTNEETDANIAIAKRMFYQFQDSNLTWDEIRDRMPKFTIINVLRKCAEQKKVSLKDLTVILIIDGMQNALINDNNCKDKRSLFDSFLIEIIIAVKNNDSPSIIACCTATSSGPFCGMICNSHQFKVFLPIRSLDPPKKGGKNVFMDTPLLRMLIDDMGGNGRALEALEFAVKGLENFNFLSIAERIYHQLKDHYIEWINKTSYLIPVLRAILTHTPLVARDYIPGTNIYPEELSKLGLIKFEKKHELSDMGTLTCPYIWLWLMANASDHYNILRNWNFKYYNELQDKEDPTIPPGCSYWMNFEHFSASFRIFKSKIFGENEQIKLKDIHAGSKHNFDTKAIINIPLSLEKAIHLESTKSNTYSTNKNKMIICMRNGNQIELHPEDASDCIINGSNAPSGDLFCPIHFTNSPQLYIESHQCKLLKSTEVSQAMFDNEHKKATDKGDVFILYTSGSSDVDNLPSLSAIVDDNHWRSYFGPFAGRAFLLAHSDQLNANKAKFSELTSVTGKVHADRLISERSTRPFSDLEDCYERTKIPRNILENLQFKI